MKIKEVIEKTHKGKCKICHRDHRLNKDNACFWCWGKGKP